MAIRELKDQIARLPEQPGVYLYFNAAGETIYVGKARALRDRVRNYLGAYGSSPKTDALLDDIARLEFIVTDSVVEALACGLPALLSNECGIARLVDEANAGIRISRTPAAAADALDRLQADAAACGGRARALAERVFRRDRFIDDYRRLYTRVAATSGAVVDGRWS